ncbi:EamA family transporter [Heliobacillus mobilis]|uniref:EamA family transporter n=1 Tax=Heliobacterium mobile TaxID=28064 RepID=A0A6I3SIM3_HELMO|nr:EamA family transporter [Heliobacterium mobile]MTV48656.1 EamA family transporter [Heliobacterium mobile]
MKSALGSGFYTILISIFLGACGQVLLKLGANRLAIEPGPLWDTLVQGLLQMAKNPLIIGGLFLFGCSSILWIMAVSKVQLSLAYPMVSLSYIIVLFASWALLGEPVTLMRIGGVLVICFGVFLIAQS